MGRFGNVLVLVAVCGFSASCSSGSDGAAQSSTVPATEAAGQEETTPPPPIGDGCLIGRWVTEVQQLNDISFNDEKVPVSGAAGYVITFTAAGTELQDANNSQPLIGAYHGGQLSVVQRGQGSFTVRADGQHYAESGPDQPFSLEFFLNGDPKDTFSSANTPNEAQAYTCDDSTLTLTGGATPQDKQVLTRS